jgi:diguanylate cyclase (GGDEF)-like protein/PAS domain S-box-containing protein
MFRNPDIDPIALLNDIYSSTTEHALITTDLQGRVTTWNAGAAFITGYSADEILGKDYSVIFTPMDLARNEPQLEIEIARTTGCCEDYRWHLRKDGSSFWADGILTLMHDGKGQHVGYLKIFRDITERRIAEQENYRIANTDMLTGLANRYALEKHAIDLIAITMRSEQMMCLHMIDFDRFKQINDTLGHHAGDLLLQQASERMRLSIRDCDYIGRMGGDEFIVLQANVPTMQAGGELAEKIFRAISWPFDINGHEVNISCSIGIAVCPHDAIDLDQLMKKADLALYRAKEDGKGRYHYFTEQLDAIAHNRSIELTNLRIAVDNKDFWVAYQPQVAFADGRVLGAEALLRCSSPAFAGYPVERIVDRALEARLMKNLSYWVLRQTCAQMREWKESGLGELKVSINLCSQDLTDLETPVYVSALLSEMDLDPANLEIELTERQALDVEHHGMNVLQALREIGLKIALDDFGTGYSALSYLRDLPVTSVKLDKSFLVGVPHDAQSMAVIKAVIDLSRGLGLEVVAEGVETEEQEAFLRKNDCTALQGFLLSRPLSAPDMTAWFRKNGAMVH